MVRSKNHKQGKEESRWLWPCAQAGSTGWVARRESFQAQKSYSGKALKPQFRRPLNADVACSLALSVLLTRALFSGQKCSHQRSNNFQFTTSTPLVLGKSLSAPTPRPARVLLLSRLLSSRHPPRSAAPRWTTTTGTSTTFSPTHKSCHVPLTSTYPTWARFSRPRNAISRPSRASSFPSGWQSLWRSSKYTHPSRYS